MSIATFLPLWVCFVAVLEKSVITTTA